MTAIPFKFTSGGSIPQDVAVGIVLKRDPPPVPTPAPVAAPAGAGPRGWSWSATLVTRDATTPHIYTFSTSGIHRFSGWSPAVGDGDVVSLEIDPDGLNAYFVRIEAQSGAAPIEDDAGFEFVGDPLAVDMLERSKAENHAHSIAGIIGRGTEDGDPTGLGDGDTFTITSPALDWPLTFSFAAGT